WFVALLRLRASVQCRRRGGKSAAELSDRACRCHSAFHRHVFSPHHVLTRSIGKLAELAHRIFFRCRTTRRWALAGFCDDHRCDDHQSFAAECHGADRHAHAIHHGGGWVSATRTCGEASALWHTVDRHHRVLDRKSTRLNSSHLGISYAVFCLKKKTRHT